MTFRSTSADVGRVLAIVSQKGGVGKTTTAVNLAAALGRRGVRTLLVDLDPQGSVRFGVGLPTGSRHDGFVDYLSGARELRDVILPTPLPRLRVLLVGTIAEGGNHVAYQHQLANGRVLEEMLAAAREEHEVVILDTPPGMGPIVRQVLGSSDEVLIPVQCEPLALQTTPQILRGLQEMLSANPNLALTGLLLTMFEAGNPVSERVSGFIRETLPEGMVLDIVIPRTVAAVDAFAAGQPVVLRTPDDPAAQAYVALAAWLAEPVAP